MTDPEMPDEPVGAAGPDRNQRFNAARLLVASIAAVVVGAVYLVNALNDGRSIDIAVLLLVGGLVGTVFGIRMVRRYWVRHDGLTLDENDPKRTPEQQLRRDERVRRNSADMTPRQEIAVGAGLIPFALLFGSLHALFGNTIRPSDLFLAGAFIVLGLVLLVRGLVRRGRSGAS